MASRAVLALLLSILALILYVCLLLAKNVRIAKASGLPYVVVPYYTYNRVTSLLMSRTLLRLADRFLSEPTTTSWRRLVTSNWAWKLKHAPFASLGVDTFLTVAPGGIVLNTADADVIADIMARPVDFPKAAHLYRTVNIYGENVVSSEGPVWRHHRRLTSPSFTEKNNRLVWHQTLDGCHAMLAGWLSRAATQDKTIRTVADDAMKLSLGVIARAGLGQKVDWPDATAQNTEVGKEELSRGHKMTFTASLTHLLRNVLYVIILPNWFQKRGPVAAARKAYQSYLEWGQYMEEMIKAKRSATEDEKSESATTDLLSQLVKQQDAKYGSPPGQTGLTDSEIMGNLFVMVLAGHETSASSIHFCLVLLALHPPVQMAVQSELDEIFKERRDDSSQWDYERDLPRLLNSRLAAVLNEELRLIAPVINIPKFTTTAQQLAVDGREITVPAKTIVRLCVPSVHHNPRFWPSSPHKDPQGSDDLREFRPQRWLERASNGETSDRLLVPKTGAYIPFSDGARACLGRRFAQVEILAALALILSQCSVELAVDEWATDKEIESMTAEEKAAVWSKAEEKVNWTLQNKMIVIITLQLRGAFVPLRVVRRGEERFAGL